jgi:hypothetical protein
VTDDEWTAYRSAAALIGDEDEVLRALMTGAIKSQGWLYNSTAPEDITAHHWATMTFLPTFKGPLSEKMRALGWLVPVGTELNRVCRRFRRDPPFACGRGAACGAVSDRAGTREGDGP